MRRITTFIASLVMVLALSAPAVAKPNKVEICHWPGHQPAEENWEWAGQTDWLIREDGQEYDHDAVVAICEEYGGHALWVTEGAQAAHNAYNDLGP